jgi:hypothetical protein
MRTNLAWAALLATLLAPACKPEPRRPLTYADSCALTMTAFCDLAYRCSPDSGGDLKACRRGMDFMCTAPAQMPILDQAVNRPVPYTRAEAQRCAKAIASFPCVAESADGGSVDVMSAIPECRHIKALEEQDGKKPAPAAR